MATTVALKRGAAGPLARAGAERWSRAALAVAALTVAGGLLRFTTLGRQSFWYDETVTARLLHMSLGGMLGALPHSESSPPVYYVLAWFWTHVLGTSDVAIRSLSALAGTLMIPCAYAAARELVSRRAGLIAAALIAVHPYLVWYSQEARAYALVALFSTVGLLYFARALNTGATRPLALWAVFSVLAIATHYFAAFVVIPEALWLLRTPSRRAALAATGGIALFSAPLLALLLAQRSTGNANWITDASLVERERLNAKVFLLGMTGNVPHHLVTIAALVGVALVARAWAMRHRDPGSLAVLTVGLVGIALPLALALVGFDYFFHRNLIGSLVALLVFAGAALAGTRRAWIGVAGAVALCGLWLVLTLVGTFSQTAWHRDDFRGVARALGAAQAPRAIVVRTGTDHCDTTLSHYMTGLRPLPPGGAAVSEIDVVESNAQSDCGAPPPAGPGAPAPGFRRVDAQQIQNLQVVRFRSGAPRPVSLDALRRLYATQPGTGILLDRK